MNADSSSADATTPVPTPPLPVQPAAPLSALEARVLGCLIEKELATPDIYPLTLNTLINACNQRSNRDPVMDVVAREVEAALEQLRQKRLVTLFSGADARVPKFKQKLEAVYPLTPAARALLGELLLRGPQTSAGLRANTERLHPMPAAAEFEALIAELAQRPAGALVRQLPRQPGQKEARWVQLLTAPPSLSELRRDSSSGSATRLHSDELRRGTAGEDVERRLAALEAEVVHLRAELTRLREELDES